MKKSIIRVCLFLATVSVAFAAMPFAPLPQDEPIGIEASIWRFSSSLKKESRGTIEIIYSEEEQPERILGSVEVYPFVSTESKMPDLRVLFARDLKSAERKVVLIVGYGPRSGVFIVDVPGLTSNSLVMLGSPAPDSKGDIMLVGFGYNGASGVGSDGLPFKGNGPDGYRGRLKLRYIQSE